MGHLVVAADVSPGQPSYLALGVAVAGGPSREEQVRAFSRDAGRTVQLVSSYVGWAYEDFDTAGATAARSLGATPLVTWEPWDYRRGLDQRGFSLDSIAGGAHDGYVRRFAGQVKAFGSAVLIRFAHEMNGGWYPWGIGVNGTTAADYIAAWRHVVGIFREVGANNSRWVWSPNVDRGTASPLTATWPGSDVVNWIGLDGYNGGAAVPWGGWVSGEQIFSASLTALHALAPQKPIMIAETGCVEVGGDKAGWINDLFSWLHHRPEITAVVWFNEIAQADWRITTSEAARQAFACSLVSFAFLPLTAGDLANPSG